MRVIAIALTTFCLAALVARATLAGAAAPPRLNGSCPTNQFYGIYGKHDIGVSRACDIGIAARDDGAVNCVLTSPSADYPVGRAEHRSFRGYALTNTLYGVRFARGAAHFILGVQCS